MSNSLVILVPSNEGIVVATEAGARTDGLRLQSGRRFTVFRPARVVFTVTGESRLPFLPADGTRLQRWISKVTPRFDGNHLVEGHLRRLRPDGMDQEWVGSLSAHFVQALGSRLSRDPLAVEKCDGKEICGVVLAQFQRATRLATIASFLIRVDEHGMVEAGESLFKTFRPEDEFALLKFGETVFLSKHLLGGTGRRHLGESLYRRIEVVDRISELGTRDAAHIAHALIVAASRTAEEVSGRPRISERTQVLLVDGSDSVARELHLGTDYE